MNIRRGQARCGLVAVIAAVGAISVGPGMHGRASAQAPPNAISVWIVPSVVGGDTAAMPTVLRDGVELDAGACELTEVVGDPARPNTIRMLDCQDLPEGNYQVVVNDVEDGSFVAASCVDITAAATSATTIPIGNGYQIWGCHVLVGPPTIRVPDPLTDPLGTEIADATGTVVSVGCTRAVSFDEGLRDCGPLPLGVYTTRATADLGAIISDGADVVCYPDDTNERFEVNDRPRSRGRVIVSEQHPIWSCYQDTIVPLLTFDVLWSPRGADATAADWLGEGAVSVVEIASGADVDSCVLTLTPAGSGQATTLRGTCDDLADGTYRLELVGVLAELFVANECGEVLVNEFAPGAYCSISVSDQPLDSPEPDSGDDPVAEGDDTDTTGELPVTGVSTALLLGLGAMLTLIGGTLVAPSRRTRPRRSSEQRIPTGGES